MAAYRGEAAGNGAKAAILAGYAKGSAKVTASRLLTKANVHAAIANLVSKSESASIANALERDEILSMIAREGKNLERVMAIKELNKCSGRHIQKVEHSGGPITMVVSAADERI